MALLAALRLVPEGRAAGAEKRHAASYLDLEKQIEPGHDEFPGEKIAMQIRSSLHAAVASRQLPLATSAMGQSPCPHGYEALAADLHVAYYNPSDNDIAAGWNRWLQSLGSIRRLEFYPLPDSIVRYEVSSLSDSALQHRVGFWKQVWQDGRLVSFEPIEEHLATAPEPWFRDVTAEAFGELASFRDQLSRGIPYWRARLDPATGIDIYGSNGVAVGDIDNDGADELYVCQPGGLPNRLYKVNANGRLTDITEQWKVGLLDDTSCALFLDLRNSGRQDLVVLRSAGPTLFLNNGLGFVRQDDAFRFATPPRGNFTGMAAADFDRDGKLDLYLCCYVYFQSEAQYTYAAPYYDAQNGPPNFLFRNQLNPDGGHFEDCTAQTGIDQNNNRFSFAPAWCDFNGDGWPDLYVANDFGRKNLYVNNNGHFEDRAQQAGVEDVGPGMSASWFDYDGDGKPDLYVANMWSDAGQRVVRDPNFAPAHREKAAEAYRLHTRGNSLYRNRGDGSFEDATESQGAAFGRWAWASGGHDLDNDGSPELLTTCGMLTNTSDKDLMSFFWRQVVAKSPDEATASIPYQNGWNAINQFIREDYSWSGHEPNVLHGSRGGHYFDFSGVSGLDFAEDGRAFAVCDFDGDGRPDVILKSRLGPQVRILQNNCAHAHSSIAFVLKGTKSNRDAIGARVRVNGQTKWLEAGSGFLSQHSKRLLFGLGSVNEVKQVDILWPSGAKQSFTDLRAGRTYFLTEGLPNPHSEPFRNSARLLSRQPASNNIPALSDTWLSEPLPLPEKVSGSGLFVIDDHYLNASPERRQQYEIFRRYLFDWRTALQPPLALLLNKSGQAVKVYARVPSDRQCREDLRKIEEHSVLALPFPGEYVVKPQRDIFKFGVAFLWAGYTAQALPYLQEKLRRNPDNARVLVLVSQIELTDENFPSAERGFRRALELESQSPEAAYGLGLALAKQGRLDEARDAFKQAITIRHVYPDAINDLGALYIQQGKVNDAVAAFRYGVEMAPDENILYMNLARIYVKLGQLDSARQVMQKLLDRKPDDAGARRALQELNSR